MPSPTRPSLAVGVTAASIALHDAATGRLVFRAAAGPEGGGVVGLSVAANEGIAGYAFSTGQPLAIADVAADPRFERATAERTGYLPRSLLAVPLVDDAGVTGVMELLDRRDGRPFDLADMELAARFAAAATIVARTRRVDRDAVGLLRSALVGVAADGAGADGLGPDAIEALLAAATEALADDDPTLAPGRPDRPPARGRPGRRRARDRLARRAPRPAGAPRILGSLTTPWPVAA